MYEARAHRSVVLGCVTSCGWLRRHPLHREMWTPVPVSLASDASRTRKKYSFVKLNPFKPYSKSGATNECGIFSRIFLTC